MIPQVAVGDLVTKTLPDTFALVLGPEHVRGRSAALLSEIEEAEESVEGMDIVPYFIGDVFPRGPDGKKTGAVRSRYFFFNEKEAFAFVMANGGTLSTHPWPPHYDTDMAKFEGFLDVIYSHLPPALDEQ